MFASRYFPNGYFPKTYFPESLGTATTESPSGAGNWNNLPKWNKRPRTVRELIERDREARELKARQGYDGQFIPVAPIKPQTLYSALSVESQRQIDKWMALRQQQDAQAILDSLQEQVRRFFLLGLFGE